MDLALRLIGWIAIVVGVFWTILMTVASLGFGGPTVGVLDLVPVLILPLSVLVGGIIFLVGARVLRNRA